LIILPSLKWTVNSFSLERVIILNDISVVETRVTNFPNLGFSEGGTYNILLSSS